jgi:hypothetical protein
VSSVIVVELEPGVEGVGSGGVAGEDLPVGPFGLQGAVEALDFPVLPGTVWADEALLGAERGDGGPEVCAVPVGEGVVADDAFDGDAVAGEELPGASQEVGGVAPFSSGRISA